jgi:cell division septal protein FtsQ
MKYKRKEKKNNNKAGKKRDPKEKSNLIIIGLSVGLFLLTVTGLSVFTYRVLYMSDYFFIKESRIDWSNKPLTDKNYFELINTGVGKNIFEVDIKETIGGVLKRYPEFKDIKVMRDFPDKLTLEIDARTPVAQVGKKNFFLIDDEGVVLTDMMDSIREGLPVISGIRRGFLSALGSKNKSLRIKRALALLAAIDAADFLDEHTLTRIDVANPRNLSFYIEEGLEIKIGHSNFPERIEALDKTLDSMLIGKDEIKYIDLRFDDVVLGTR